MALFWEQRGRWGSQGERSWGLCSLPPVAASPSGPSRPTKHRVETKGTDPSVSPHHLSAVFPCIPLPWIHSRRQRWPLGSSLGCMT